MTSFTHAKLAKYVNAKEKLLQYFTYPHQYSDEQRPINDDRSLNVHLMELSEMTRGEIPLSIDQVVVPQLYETTLEASDKLVAYQLPPNQMMNLKTLPAKIIKRQCAS